MKEAQYINKSLSALGDVMEALDQKSKHIPYRQVLLSMQLSLARPLVILRSRIGILN
jgi:hypothetical protein